MYGIHLRDTTTSFFLSSFELILIRKEILNNLKSPKTNLKIDLLTSGHYLK